MSETTGAEAAMAAASISQGDASDKPAPIYTSDSR